MPRSKVVSQHIHSFIYPLIHISNTHRNKSCHTYDRVHARAASHICSLPKELYSLPKEPTILLKEPTILLKERFRMAKIRKMPNLHIFIGYFSQKSPVSCQKPSILLKERYRMAKIRRMPLSDSVKDIHVIFIGHSPKQSPVSYGVATISRLLKIIGLFCKRALC